MLLNKSIHRMYQIMIKNNNRKTVEKLDAYKAVKEEMPYTSLCNNVLQNFKDPIALAIWSYLQSLPPDWIVIKSQIRDHFGIGEKKCKSSFSLLNKCKLIMYDYERNKDGTLGKHIIIVKNGSEFLASFLDNDPIPEPVSTTGSKTDPVVQPQGQLSTRWINHPCGKEGTTNTIYNTNKNNIKNMCQTKKNAVKSNLVLDADCVDVDYEYLDTYYEEKEEKNKIPAFITQSNPFNISDITILDWLVVRKRKPVTKTTWSRLSFELTKIHDAGLDVIDAFETMVECGWSSLKLDWYKNTIANQGKNKKQSVSRDVSQDEYFIDDATQIWSLI